MNTAQIKILWNEQEIKTRVEKMGQEIAKFYQGKDLTVVVVSNGGMFFGADLIRHITIPLFCDSLAVESYSNDQRGANLMFRSKLKLSPRGRHILILDEVLDSGHTLKGVVDYMYQQGAVDVRTAVIVQKDIPRNAEAIQQADWCGFHSLDHYLVGYGMDSMELYRNLPYIGYLEQN